MVVVLENNIGEEQINEIVKQLEDFGFQIHKSTGVQRTILGYTIICVILWKSIHIVMENTMPLSDCGHR